MDIMKVMKLKQVNKDSTISVTLPEYRAYAKKLGGKHIRTYKFHGYPLKLSLQDRLRVTLGLWIGPR